VIVRVFPYSYGSRTNVPSSAGSVNIRSELVRHGRIEQRRRWPHAVLIARQVFQHRLAGGFGLLAGKRRPLHAVLIRATFEDCGRADRSFEDRPEGARSSGAVALSPHGDRRWPASARVSWYCDASWPCSTDQCANAASARVTGPWARSATAKMTALAVSSARPTAARDNRSATPRRGCR
jgi:hypothetical protein